MPRPPSRSAAAARSCSSPRRCGTTSPRSRSFAGGFATAFAIVLGYALATLFARRIRRLETAAERIAGGRFDEAVVDAAPDELGQLARAFERMRLQLASLD